MLLITPVASFQDNQTDSGMVLASEEFERIENRHRKEGGFRYSSLATQPSLLPNAVRPGGSSWCLLIGYIPLGACRSGRALGYEPDKSMHINKRQNA